MPNSFFVGRTVYIGERSGMPRPHQISKVGRKWAYYDNNYRRFDMASRRTEDGRGVWCSLEEREEERLLQAAWNDLRQNMPWSPPEGTSLEAINTARAFLGMRERK